ncbi:DUF6894 family protein [Mesorhizobium sp. Cs1299R1N3]|uniref:DUF6894 family protein n=1 Tax=Mesorhizobium sp. Cs1299R1N3 TaxID=3015173 RepID=UPI003FA53783
MIKAEAAQSAASHQPSLPDTEATDLPILQSAEDKAARALLEIAKDKVPDGTFGEVALHVHANCPCHHDVDRTKPRIAGPLRTVPSGENCEP